MVGLFDIKTSTKQNDFKEFRTSILQHLQHSTSFNIDKVSFDFVSDIHSPKALNYHCISNFLENVQYNLLCFISFTCFSIQQCNSHWLISSVSLKT